MICILFVCSCFILKFRLYESLTFISLFQQFALRLEKQNVVYAFGKWNASGPTSRRIDLFCIFERDYKKRARCRRCHKPVVYSDRLTFKAFSDCVRPRALWSASFCDGKKRGTK